MWVIAMFDLPTDTKEKKKVYSNFRRTLLKNGFTMMQYSVYIRACGSEEQALSHMDRMSKCLPDIGEVRLVSLTDKQFGRMRVFRGKNALEVEQMPRQLELF